jgi:hypothetical protein
LKNYLVLFLLYIGFSNALSAQVAAPSLSSKNINTTKVDSNVGVVTWKLLTAVGTTASSLGVTYYHLNNIWWKNNTVDFHIDHDIDYRYAKNIDKLGHFLGGNITAELLQGQLEWTGMKEKQAATYSLVFSALVQGFIEIKDGYAPDYGFSVGDVAAGSAGAFVHFMKSRIKAVDAIEFKMSYYKKHDYYFREYPFASYDGDYMNQTYWVSMAVNDWMREGSKVEKFWPDFLTIALGMGVDEKLNSYYNGQQSYDVFGTGSYEYYLSLDLDWRKILPQRNGYVRFLSKTLNHIKTPLPTLKFSPQFKGYAVFY